MVCRTIILPLELCQFVLQNKLVTTFKMYLMLKYRCSGILKLSKAESEQLCTDMGFLSNKSFKKHLKLLIKLNWIGYNEQTEYYFIRSLEYLRKQNSFYRRKGVEFSFDWIETLKEFLFSSVAKSLIEEQKRKLIHRSKILAIRRGVLQKGCTLQPLPIAFPIALSVFGKVLKMSRENASIIKSSAVEIGFIKVKSNIVQTSFNEFQLNAFKKAYSEFESD